MHFVSEQEMATGKIYPKAGDVLTFTVAEADPSGKAPHEPGAKLDQGKAPVFQGVMMYFPRALLAVAQVSAYGAQKYTWNGWRSVADGPMRYANARERHILKEQVEGPFDSETGGQLRHKAQVAWNALAALELELAAVEIKGNRQ